MRFSRSLYFVMGVLVFFLALAGHAAGAGEIVSVPPAFHLDKQIPGEDDFWIYRPTFSPDGRYIAAFMSGTKVITIWDTQNGKVVKEIPDSIHGMDALDGLEFSKDGKQLIILRSDKPMKFIDWEKGSVSRSISLAADPKKILDYAFSPDGRLLAVATYKGIQLWDVNQGKKLKEFCQGVTICTVDMLIYTTPKGKKVRLLAYARALMPPESQFKDVAGIIDMDSGAVTPILKDVPEDKKVSGNMTFFLVRFEWGGSWLFVGYYVIPPKVKAGVYLVNVGTGKYLANHDLANLTISYAPRYLGKPFYGFLIGNVDMSQAGEPYKTAIQFLVPTKEGTLKVLDTIDEKTLPMQSLTVDKSNAWAALTLKKDQMDKSRLYLYKLVPKK